MFSLVNDFRAESVKVCQSSEACRIEVNSRYIHRFKSATYTVKTG